MTTHIMIVQTVDTFRISLTF